MPEPFANACVNNWRYRANQNMTVSSACAAQALQENATFAVVIV
jgi:hypothetical protein